MAARCSLSLAHIHPHEWLGGETTSLVMLMAERALHRDVMHEAAGADRFLQDSAFPELSSVGSFSILPCHTCQQQWWVGGEQDGGSGLCGGVVVVRAGRKGQLANRHIMPCRYGSHSFNEQITASGRLLPDRSVASEDYLQLVLSWSERIISMNKLCLLLYYHSALVHVWMI